ncbi:MAG TPA: ATP-binding protein [Nitrospira sp.]|nr:ATP-binding protein [Nitrospira sp.]
MAAAASPASVRPHEVNWTVAGISGLLLITALAVVPLTLTVIHSRESDALVIDLAGRQRMLLERHMKEVLLASQGVEADYRQTRAALTERVQTLIQGGTTVADLDRDGTVTIPAAPTGEIRQKLLEQQRLMASLFVRADAFLLRTGAGAPSAATREALLKDHAALLTVANDAVILLARHSGDNVRTLIRWELAVVLLVMAVGTLGTWRFLRAERALKQSQALTLQALHQRDAVKSSLLSSVSHELRTPLTAIKTMLFSLQHDGTSLPDAIRREFLTGIDRELDYLNRLIGNLLDMSRLEAGTLQPRREWQVLDELVEGAIRRVGLLLADRPLHASLDRNLPPIFADGVQLQQVLVNLLDNAIKFSPPGSPIRLEASLVDGCLDVRVSNSGEGVPPGELDRIFDRFYRVQSGRSSGSPGTGLGLAICKGIVEAHGGSILAKSVPGAETTIQFRIPLPASPPAGDRPTPEPTAVQGAA